MKNAGHKRQIPHDSTSTRYREQSHALRQKVEWSWLPGAGVAAWGVSGLIGVEFSFSKMEKALETGYTTRVYSPLTQLYT